MSQHPFVNESSAFSRFKKLLSKVSILPNIWPPAWRSLAVFILTIPLHQFLQISLRYFSEKKTHAWCRVAFYTSTKLTSNIFCIWFLLLLFFWRGQILPKSLLDLEQYIFRIKKKKENESLTCSSFPFAKNHLKVVKWIFRQVMSYLETEYHVE